MATLLPSGEGTLTPRGIEFNGLHYTCAMAEDDQWFVRYRRRPGHIPLSWNPADPQHIYLRLNNGQDIVQCQLVDRAREHNLGEADWGDILDYLTVKTIEDKHAFLPDLIREIPFDQHADQIIQQETELSEIAQKGHTTASRLKGMKGVRAVEARVDQLGQLTTERQTDPASSSDDDNEYVGKPLFLQSPSTPKELPNAH